MDLAPASAITTSSNTKSPDADCDTPTRIQPSSAKSLPFTNGVLKRHHSHARQPAAALPQPPVVVTYKECLKNHAASLGAHALDGCGEFMPSPSATPTDPTSLKCAACGCHRNFHRRDPEDPISTLAINTAATHVIEYQPHHRHHPPPPPVGNRSPNSASPPPISSSYYPSAPHMLLALSTGLSGLPPENNAHTNSASPHARKRFRTKFSNEQKEKMLQFAEKVGWKMQKRDDDLVHEFCNQVGVERGVLKVWMHNNKNTMGKKPGDSNGTTTTTTTAAAAATVPAAANNNNNNYEDGELHMNVGSNGSSSSS